MPSDKDEETRPLREAVERIIAEEKTMKNQTKFKEGDRVRLVGKSPTAPDVAKEGMVGTVIDPPAKIFSSVAIDLDGVPRNHGPFGEGWYFSPKYLELLETDA